VKERTLVGGPGDGQTVVLRDDQTWLTVIVRLEYVDRMNPFGPRGIPSYMSMPYEEHLYTEDCVDGAVVLVYNGVRTPSGVHGDGSESVGGQDVPESDSDGLESTSES
jgi:hypothetical protein